MQNETYEEYIKSILGYSTERSYNDFEMQTIEQIQMQTNVNNELESLYPEIYKIVYPMVLKNIKTNMDNITKEKIDNITQEIYDNIEGNSDKRVSNEGLRDLIRILIIRELLNNMNRPSRPHFPGYRPPFNRPGFGPRPPFYREFEDNKLDIYEI